MANCMGCRSWIPNKPDNRRGECWFGKMSRFENGKWIAGDSAIPAKLVKDAMSESCKEWTLLCMGQRKGRSVRTFIFDANNNVALK